MLSVRSVWLSITEVLDFRLILSLEYAFTGRRKSARLKNVTLAGNTVDLLYVGKSGASTNKTDADLLAVFSTPFYNNTILSSSEPNILKLIQPFNYSNPDFTPYASAGPATSGNLSTAFGTLGLNTSLDYKSNGSFSDALLQDAFFDKTATFRGAVATSGVNQAWWRGWTSWK